jgi:hypothetical protein
MKSGGALISDRCGHGHDIRTGPPCASEQFSTPEGILDGMRRFVASHCVSAWGALLRWDDLLWLPASRSPRLLLLALVRLPLLLGI